MAVDIYGHLRTRSPKTGECLRFGPAMRQAATSVHLPGVAALFADIASQAPQRPWDLRPPSPPPVRSFPSDAPIRHHTGMYHGYACLESASSAETTDDPTASHLTTEPW